VVGTGRSTHRRDDAVDLVEPAGARRRGAVAHDDVVVDLRHIDGRVEPARAGGHAGFVGRAAEVGGAVEVQDHRRGHVAGARGHHWRDLGRVGRTIGVGVAAQANHGRAGLHARDLARREHHRQPQLPLVADPAGHGVPAQLDADRGAGRDAGDRLREHVGAVAVDDRGHRACAHRGLVGSVGGGAWLDGASDRAVAGLDRQRRHGRVGG
jgi:hypothetical protein